MVRQDNGRAWARVTLVLALAWSVAVSCAPATSGPAPSTPAASYTTSPLPSLAAGFTRFDGMVVESGTQKPLADVCVVIATGGTCQPSSPRTDSGGFWWIDVPTGVEWDFIWTKDGYEPLTMHLRSDGGEFTIRVLMTPKPAARYLTHSTALTGRSPSADPPNTQTAPSTNTA